MTATASAARHDGEANQESAKPVALQQAPPSAPGNIVVQRRRSLASFLPWTRAARERRQNQPAPAPGPTPTVTLVSGRFAVAEGLKYAVPPIEQALVDETFRDHFFEWADSIGGAGVSREMVTIYLEMKASKKVDTDRVLKAAAEDHEFQHLFSVLMQEREESAAPALKKSAGAQPADAPTYFEFREDKAALFEDELRAKKGWAADKLQDRVETRISQSFKSYLIWTRQPDGQESLAQLGDYALASNLDVRKPSAGQQPEADAPPPQQAPENLDTDGAGTTEAEDQPASPQPQVAPSQPPIVGARARGLMPRRRAPAAPTPSPLSLPAQERQGTGFVTADRKPNISEQSIKGLRYSASGGLAVEDTDLSSRQAKVFFTSADVLARSNAMLQGAASPIELVATGRTVPGVGGAGGGPGGGGQAQRADAPQDLMEVIPRNVMTNEQGYKEAGGIKPLNVGENCNEVAKKVMGSARPPEAILDSPLELAIADDFEQYLIAERVALGDEAVGVSAQDVEEDPTLGGRGDQIATQYASKRASDPKFAERLQAYGVNEYAATPEVGEGMVTHSLGKIGARQFTYHWGGVVARDGDDYVTLENYTRRDESANVGGSDVNSLLYYFQMYGPSRTWHDQLESSGAYAEPISFRVGSVNTEGEDDPRRKRWDTHASEQWGGQIATILNHHARLAGAASPPAVILELLKGLALALHGGRMKRSTRSAWVQAADGAARTWSHVSQVGPLANYVLERLRKVKRKLF